MKAKNTKINLCDNCSQQVPECSAINIEFGDGYGNDNVIECDGYDETNQQEEEV